MYKRKTYDEWQLLVNYGYGDGFEVETTELSRGKIKEQLKCYRENAPQYSYKIRCKRVRIEVK